MTYTTADALRDLDDTLMFDADSGVGKLAHTAVAAHLTALEAVASAWRENQDTIFLALAPYLTPEVGKALNEMAESVAALDALGGSDE